jgi:hypothetical protein
VPKYSQLHNNVLSPNEDDNGAEEEEAAVGIVKDKGEDFAMGWALIRRDNAATMMDASPPLLPCCPLPFLGLPLQRDDTMAGAKNAVAFTTTAAKVGIVACATSSSGTMMNAMYNVTWWQSCNDIDYNDNDKDQCQ